MYNHNPKLLEFEEFKEKLKVTSHDLNNILNNILNGIELIKDQTKSENEYVSKILNHLEKNTNLAHDLIAGLTSAKKSNTKDFVVIELNQLFSDIIDIAGNNDKNLIRLNCSEDKALIRGDYTELKRLFLNLISNGREACTKSSTISINIAKIINSKSSTESNLVKINIADNGAGIIDTDLQNIFENGFSTKSSVTNSGLGLYIVKDIIEKHNGNIKVTSKKNVGTEFEIFLPLISIAKQKDPSNKTVIVAEDDEFQREVLKDLLVSMKLNVFTASNGNEALELYSSLEPDILFIDEKMPKMSGLECSKKISSKYKTPNIVLVTGSSTTSLNPELKIAKILHKPYSFKMVENTINELLQE